MDPSADALTVELAQARPIPLAVSMSCAGGERLALVGPSGSGKSTVLRAIAGVYSPARGRVAVGAETWFDSAAGRHRPARERSVGELEEEVGLSQSGISQHLAILRREHVVATRRDKQTVFYSLASADVVALMATLHKVFCKPAKAAARPKLRAVA